PDLRALLRGAVWSQSPHAECVELSRRRLRTDERLLQEVQHLRHSRRQYRRADGRLVPPRDQYRGGFEGIEIPPWRLRGSRDAETGGRSDAGGGRRDIYLTGTRHDRRRRVGWPLRRREARLQQGCEVLL